ncbi:hypothetical protein GMOD_00005467 [Pyrenophora seminiperda CCB06]|uniref:Uncharacterized protein n=1 Tax=Pyrenophora seminiperda CCB06 TaxID=1302712 RepID=A0A3M7LW18_9PLEO|nr:hypothetical protein GMOD_00005467 [Pyrenophora seminiperda CCB06]
MHCADEKNRCWLCGKHRSGNALHERGWAAQICRRLECAESKRLLTRLLQKISECNGSAGSLAFEVHHYHHFSHPSEADPNRTHTYSSELHAESLPRNHEVLPVRGGPFYVGAFTQPSENMGTQRLARSA